MITEMLERLGQTGLATTISENALIFPWLEVCHVIAITTVLGTIFIVDLRLLGLASTSLRVSRLTRVVLPVTWIAFCFAALTGGLMFLSQPVNYFNNFAFRMKMVMLIAAGMNMAMFHLFTSRSVHLWDEGGTPTPAAARVAGLVSILIWITITGAGRWIGFSLSNF